MKTIRLLFFVSLLICGAWMLNAFKNHKQIKTDNKSTQDKSFAVVELFTSEGCSSCPAADGLVAKIQQEVKDKPVYILAYHVDYWNRLGWKDVFSSADYSHRQNQYAEWLNLQSIYTPQIVVNGTTEFVGSDNTKLQNAIDHNLKIAEKNQLRLDGFKIVNNESNFAYHINNPVQNSSLLVAVVQQSAQTKVKGGENGGRTLSHVQIVRSFKSIALNGKKDGNAALDLPKGVDVNELEIIAFVQNVANGNIIAATKSSLNK